MSMFYLLCFFHIFLIYPFFYLSFISFCRSESDTVIKKSRFYHRCHRIARVKFTIWCANAGNAMKVIGRNSVKFIYSYNEKIWATNQQTCYSIKRSRPQKPNGPRAQDICNSCRATQKNKTNKYKQTHSFI